MGFEVITDYLLKILPYYAFKISIAILIAVLGLAIGFIVKGITRFIFHSLKLDALLEKLKVNHLFGKISTTEIFADFFEFYVFLLFFVEALNFVDFFSIAALLTQFLTWLPKFLAGFVLFLIFYVVVKYIETLILNSGHKNLKVLLPYINFVLLSFAFIVSLEQVGFKVDFLKQSFLILLFTFAFAVALALGLSLGFALKDDVKKVIEKTFKESNNSKNSKKKKTKSKRKR